MGLRVSKPECNVPTRMLIGVTNAGSIITSCALHKIAFLFGFLLVVEAVIAIGYWLTRTNEPGIFRVPIWLLVVPIAFGALYALSMRASAEMDLATETIEYQLSGMNKKEYYNYKIGDDRTAKSLTGSALGSGILASSAVLAPFLRGDR
jgi:hypothetical protein